MEQIIFWVIIGIIVLDYLFEKFLDYLNYSKMSKELPQELMGIYDAKKYSKSQKYERVNLRFSLVTSSFSFILLLLVLFFKGFAYLDDFVVGLTDNEYVRALIFFGVLGLVMDLITTPFQIYGTFVIEQNFGFNKTTAITFITDKIKSWILGALIGGGLLLFIMWAYFEMGTWFWIVVMGGITVFMIFMTMFYSKLIVPLFNKQKPLEDGSLKDAILKFSNKAGFKLDNIFVIDGSKRSTKGNAYFSGFGPKKRIVLYDTLIKELDEDEIVAVLAHEIGHYKLKHVVIGLIMSLAQSAVMLWLLYMALSSNILSGALGVDQPSFYISIIAFGLLFSPLSTLIGILMNYISRKHEYAADKFATIYGFGKHLISGLIKLSVNNLSNLTPHWFYVFVNYSHPTLLQRKKVIESNNAQN